MKYINLNLVLFFSIFIIKFNIINSNVLSNPSQLTISTTANYAKGITGANYQASPYLATSVLASSNDLVRTIGSLPPYAPEYHYFNSDYYPPEQNFRALYGQEIKSHV